MRRFRPVLALLVLAAAALSWWLVQHPEGAKKATPMAHTGPREVDYSLSGFEVVRMGPDGTPAHRLRAERLQHYTDDDTTALTQTRLTVYQGEDPPWEVRSDEAWMSADGSLLLLSGEVLIDREAGETTQSMHVVTRDLRVQPREDYAETDEKVRVETDSDWLDAVGMQAWLRPPSRLKFRSQVKGYYVPR